MAASSSADKIKPYEEKKDKMLSMITDSASSHEKWTPLKKTSGVEVFSQDCPETGFKKAKSIGIAQASFDEKELIKRIQVIYLLVDYECFLKVDKQAVKFDLVESLDEDHKIMYSHYKGMYTVSDRDFVYFRAKTETSNQIVYGTFSVDTHPTESPKGVVRAWIHFSGWCIEIIDEPEKEKIKASNITPIEGKPWLRLTYTAQVDPKGWIPAFVVNSLVGEAAQVVIRFRENLKVAREMMKERPTPSLTPTRD